MLDTFTSRAKPTAASHASNTKITMGVENVIMEWIFSEVIDVIINKESIIPSRHKSVDIRCDLNITVPRRENVEASMILKTVVIILVIMTYHNLMSWTH